jgi:hypothetical protein
MLTASGRNGESLQRDRTAAQENVTNKAESSPDDGDNSWANHSRIAVVMASSCLRHAAPQHPGAWQMSKMYLAILLDPGT